MAITNRGRQINTERIAECKEKYVSFKNTMNGVVESNLMRPRFLAFNPRCSEQLPTLGGRKKSRRHRNKGKKHTRRSK